MIVIGVDPHKQTHTAAAVDRRTGELIGELTVTAGEEGHARLLEWARQLDSERGFALEDCRQVSCRLERFLIGRGERVVRVPPKLMARTRRSARARGKSDAIDALAVARRDPRARPAGGAPRRRRARAAAAGRPPRRPGLRADPDPEPAALAPARDRPGPGAARAHARPARAARAPRAAPGAPPTDRARVRIARELVGRCRELTRQATRLEHEIETLVRREAPQLLALPGCGALTAAKLVGEVAGIERFRTDAQLAMHAGVAPLDVSSGRQQRHRLNRAGNRQLNRALHTIAITQKRIHAPAKAYLARRHAEGKTKKEALRHSSGSSHAVSSTSST
jgi:transposase